MYGITRKMNPRNFADVYFGELGALAKDVWYAPGIRNKLLYIIMPPGWSHLGTHATARQVRDAYLHAKPADKPATSATENAVVVS